MPQSSRIELDAIEMIRIQPMHERIGRFGERILMQLKVTLGLERQAQGRLELRGRQASEMRERLFALELPERAQGRA